MEAEQSLQLIDQVLDSITLIAKKGGTESGLTTQDRVQLKQAIAMIRGELNRQEAPKRKK